MKSKFYSSGKTRFSLTACLILLLTNMIFLTLPSCQKDMEYLLNQDLKNRIDAYSNFESADKSLTLYYGPDIFTRSNGVPVTITKSIENTDFALFNETFFLKIKNGNNKKTRVSSAEIRIDGVLIAGPSDFSKNVSSLSKKINGLTPTSTLEVTLMGSPGSFIELSIKGTLKQESETGTVTDIDGNIYKTIEIGSQIWMQENLKVTRFNDGSDIPLITSDAEWANLVTPGYSWYDNNEATYKDTYGALYNFYAVDTRILCPAGWHVPNDVEWSVLSDYVGGEDVAGGKLKETGTLHWMYPNEGATDEYGFKALPGGYRYDTGPFSYIGMGGTWWTSREYQPESSWAYGISYEYRHIGPGTPPKNYAQSVRCVKGEPQVGLPVLTTSPVSEVTPTGALSGGVITDDGGTNLIEIGICWSSLHTPTITDTIVPNMPANMTFECTLELLRPNRTYMVRAFATNSEGTSYGDEIVFTTSSPLTGTVEDIEGNIYGTIEIGTQTWMTENLKVTSYNDGTPVQQVTDQTEWESLSSPGYNWYDNDEATYKTKYGALYNWFTLNTDNICPSGWHVPTVEDYSTLVGFLGTSVIAGGKLKETGTLNWEYPNIGATNETGFSGMPGGSNSGGFDGISLHGMWWISTETDSQNAYSFDLNNYSKECNVASGPKTSGFSIRCLMD